jgi:hypothetical protein
MLCLVSLAPLHHSIGKENALLLRARVAIICGTRNSSCLFVLFVSLCCFLFMTSSARCCTRPLARNIHTHSIQYPAAPSGQAAALRCALASAIQQRYSSFKPLSLTQLMQTLSTSRRSHKLHEDILLLLLLLLLLLRCLGLAVAQPALLLLSQLLVWRLLHCTARGLAWLLLLLLLLPVVLL